MKWKRNGFIQNTIWYFFLFVIDNRSNHAKQEIKSKTKNTNQTQLKASLIKRVETKINNECRTVEHWNQFRWRIHVIPNITVIEPEHTIFSYIRKPIQFQSIKDESNGIFGTESLRLIWIVSRVVGGEIHFFLNCCCCYYVFWFTFFQFDSVLYDVLVIYTIHTHTHTRPICQKWQCIAGGSAALVVIDSGMCVYNNMLDSFVAIRACLNVFEMDQTIFIFLV